jgi:hypothetical protein
MGTCEAREPDFFLELEIAFEDRLALGLLELALPPSVIATLEPRRVPRETPFRPMVAFILDLL